MPSQGSHSPARGYPMKSMIGRVMVAFLLLVLASPASAQYLKITTDNPTDNTRLRVSGTTVLTITLDTNHDKNASTQTCNSHTIANGCGATATGQPLDMFSYTLALKAVGGTVTWGTFSVLNAAYTDVSPQIQNDTQIEINKARSTGTDIGLQQLGTLPVTPVSGSPGIQVQLGASTINPFGFGTGFGTSCDGLMFANTYVVGDPSDPCGATSGITGDWFDWDGATAPLVNQPPTLNPIANMTTFEGGGCRDDQAISGSDPDGNALTFAKVAGPTFMTVTTTSPTTGNIHLAAGFSDAGSYPATVSASDGTLSDQKGFGIAVVLSNRAPVLTQPANMTVAAGGTADQTLNGTDPDGCAVTFSKAAGPTFMTVTNINGTTGNVHLAPGFSDSGVYGATVRASDGTLTDSKTFTITVSSCRTPILNQPSNMTVRAGATADQFVTGTDPQGAPLTFSKVSGPTYMTVTTTSGTTGNIHLAPGLADVGTAVGTIQAGGGTCGSDTKSFVITVTANSPPILNPIANQTVCEGATADVPISGSDPDGDPLTFSLVAGPSYVTVTTTSATSGNIHLAPGFNDPGTASASVRASDGHGGSSDRSFTITVLTCDRPPVIQAISNMTVTEGLTADQVVTASDADGDPVTFSKSSGPVFMSVATIASGIGDIHLAPGFSDAGTYAAAVTASDGLFQSTAGFSITVLTSGNRCPDANPGGPYSGVLGIPVAFDGSASSDPDGNPLTYAWDFDASDGITVDATGAMVNHPYGAAGTFTVTLTVTDNGDGDPTQICSHSATTTASIAAACDATVFNGYDTIRLGSGKQFWFAYVQPATGCYVNSDVIVSSFVMKYAGRQISASGKTSVGGDKSGDGIAEIKVSFSKDDLRTLFTGTGLANGHNTVTVTLEANLVTGGLLRGTTTFDVVNNGNFTAATVSPNPLNPQATLTYTTTRVGAVRIQMFDIQGRLVKRIVDDPAIMPGTHEATIDGRGMHGEKLSSGVYYIRGVSSEGEFKQLITILK